MSNVIILRALKEFRQSNNVPADRMTLVARAIRAGFEAAQSDVSRHRRVRRTFRDMIANDNNPTELPY